MDKSKSESWDTLFMKVGKLLHSRDEVLNSSIPPSRWDSKSGKGSASDRYFFVSCTGLHG